MSKWLARTPLTSAPFAGIVGHHYDFYSVAIDHVGLAEPFPAAPGAGTTARAPVPPTITSASPLPPGTVGTAYHQALAATGGATPYTWSLADGALPPDLSLGSDGVISGTPYAAAGATFTVRVTGDDGLSSFVVRTPPSVDAMLW